jgi:glycosyltransferase involved in cell wall biosynthesis
MKVLVYFSGDITEPKGTPIRAKNVILGLIKNGAQVYFASHVIPNNLWLSGSVVVKSPYMRPFQIASFVRNNKVDIVVIITSAGLWIAPFLRFMTSAKIGVDMHSLRIEEEKIYKNLSPSKYWFLRHLELLLARSLHFAFGVCAPLGDYYKNVISSYTVVPVGVDLSMFNREVKPDPDLLNWKGTSILIGYAGNTKWYQGLDTVLEALAELNKQKPGLFKLVIVASSVEDSVSQFIKNNNLENSVYVLGKQAHDKVPSLLAASDILTIVRPLDMVTQYAFPSKFPEHAALGKPLIVSKVGDLHRYVVDGESAKIVPPKDSKSLVEALLKLTDENLRKKLGDNAYLVAKNKFEMDTVNKNLYNFLLTQIK